MTKIRDIAFLGSMDLTNIDPADPQHQRGWERDRGAFVEGKLAAGLQFLDYTVRFDGHEVGMFGVGGVSTLPEYRNQGCIRELFRRCFGEALDKGMVFSWLYPFSHVYYRQYGYELGNTQLQLEFPTELLGRFPRRGKLAMWRPGENTAPFARIYAQYAQGRNMSLVRDEATWQHLFDFDPYRDHRYAYLYRDEAGEPAAYGIFQALRQGDEWLLQFLQVAYRSPEALAGMLGCLKSLNAQIRRMQWAVDEPLPALFPEPYALKVSMAWGGMNRVLNVQKAFELMALPATPGSAVLAVTDDFWPDNDGTYRLSWDGVGREIVRTEDQPEAVLDVRALAQLVTGYRSFADGVPGAALLRPEALGTLNLLFPRKSVMISDHF